MQDILRILLADERGQDLAEYGIALAVVSASVAVAATVMGGDINTLWTNAQSAIPTFP